MTVQVDEREAAPVHRVRARVELTVIAVLSLGAYVALWSAQRSLWSNGLVAGEPPIYPRPGADLAAGSDQTVAVIVMGLVVTALFAWLVLRAPRFARAGLSWAVIALPVLIAIGLFVTSPTLSIDAYSYLSHGYLAATPGSNPYLQTSASVAGTPFGASLLAQGWQAVHPQTPYGPLWTTIERSVYVISGGNVGIGILLIKLPVALAVLGTAVLIWRILARYAPERRLRGTVLYLANPLILIELIGEGHNDGLMAFFLVLAVFAAVRRWAFVAIVAVTFAALIKLNALPFIVPIGVALVAMRHSGRRLAIEAVLGVLASVAVTVALFAPYWAGLATLTGLGASGAPSAGWSVSGWLTSVLGTPATPGFGGAATDTSSFTIQLVLAAVLVLATVAASLLARTVPGLIRACGIVSLVILLLLPLEWPWYAVLPATVLPLGAELVEIITVLILTVGSRLIAPLGDAASLGVVSPTTFTTQQALMGQTLPALIGLVLTVGRTVLHRNQRERDPRPVGVAGGNQTN